MRQDPFVRYFAGPLATGLAVAVTELAAYANLRPNLILPFAGLIVAARFSGLYANLASALAFSCYAIYISGGDAWFSGLAILVSFGIAGGSGVSKRWHRQEVLDLEHVRRKAELVDSLNGNVARMIEALDMLDEALGNRKALLSKQVEEANPALAELLASHIQKLELTRGKLADLLTLGRSWKELAEEQRYVERRRAVAPDTIRLSAGEVELTRIEHHVLEVKRYTLETNRKTAYVIQVLEALRMGEDWPPPLPRAGDNES